MNFTFVFFDSLITLLTSLPVIVLVLAIDKEPAAAGDIYLSENQIAQIQQLLIDNDPRILSNSDSQLIRLNGNEVNALLGYFIDSVPQLSRFYGSVELGEGTASLALTTRLPSTIFGSYLNLELDLVQDGEGIALQRATTGALSLSGRHIAPLLAMARNYLEGRKVYVARRLGVNHAFMA